MAFTRRRKRISHRIGCYWFYGRHVLAGLFVAGGIGAMQPAVALPKNTVVATIAVGYVAQQMVIAPNGQTLYVSNLYSKDISVIDTTSNTVKASIALGTGVNPLAITPDGQTLFAEIGGVAPQRPLPSFRLLRTPSQIPSRVWEATAGTISP